MFHLSSMFFSVIFMVTLLILLAASLSPNTTHGLAAQHILLTPILFFFAHLTNLQERNIRTLPKLNWLTPLDTFSKYSLELPLFIMYFCSLFICHLQASFIGKKKSTQLAPTSKSKKKTDSQYYHQYNIKTTTTNITKKTKNKQTNLCL